MSTDKYGLQDRVQVAKGRAQFKKVWAFRKREYSQTYPEISGFEDDSFDDHACVFFTENAEGEVISTARLVFDGPNGLPEELLISDLIASQRERGVRFAELGRFIISTEARGILTEYYKSFYQAAMANSVASIVMVMKQKDVRLHVKKMGVRLLASNLGVTFGSRHEYACVEWEMAKTKSQFFTWCGLDDGVLS